MVNQKISMKEWADSTSIDLKLDDKVSQLAKLNGHGLSTVNIMNFSVNPSELEIFLAENSPCLALAFSRQEGIKRIGKFNINDSSEFEEFFSSLQEGYNPDLFDIYLLQQLEGIDGGYVGSLVIDSAMNSHIEILKKDGLSDVTYLTSRRISANEVLQLNLSNGRLISCSSLPTIPLHELMYIVNLQVPPGYYEFAKAAIGKGEEGIFFTDYQTDEIFQNPLKNIFLNQNMDEFYNAIFYKLLYSGIFFKGNNGTEEINDDIKGYGVISFIDPFTGNLGVNGRFFAGRLDINLGASADYYDINNLPERLKKRLEGRLSSEEKFRKDSLMMFFGIESSKLHIYGFEKAYISPQSRIKVCCDLLQERVITENEIFKIISLNDIGVTIRTCLSQSENVSVAKLMASGTNDSSGLLALNAEDVYRIGKMGKKPIFAAEYILPDTLNLIMQSKGLITSGISLSGHLPIILNNLGIPYIISNNTNIIFKPDQIIVGDVSLGSMAPVSFNALTGELFDSEIQLTESGNNEQNMDLLYILKNKSDLSIYLNLDSSNDLDNGISSICDGIGLFRTEHAVLYNVSGKGSISAIYKALSEYSPKKRGRFFEILFQANEEEYFKVLSNRTFRKKRFRLLDLPIDEFYPEFSLRGHQLGLQFPEVYHNQVESLCLAYLRCKEQGYNPELEVIVPFIQSKEEYQKVINNTQSVFRSYGLTFPIGPMLETTESCKNIEEIMSINAPEFVLFGTNDLTSQVLNISRKSKSVHFREIDTEYVSPLMTRTIRRIRALGRTTEVCVCGEHVNHPGSLKILMEMGIDSVSAGAYNVANLVSNASYLRLN